MRQGPQKTQHAPASPYHLRLVPFVLGALIMVVGLIFPVSAQQVGKAETVVGSVFGESVNKTLGVGAPIDFRQKIRVGDQSAAGVRFADDTRLSLGPRTSIVIDEFVYDPNRSLLQGSINLTRGFMRFASKRGVADVKIVTVMGWIGVRGTVFDTYSAPNVLEVAVHEGVVEVKGKKDSRTVQSGEVLRMDSIGQIEVSGSPSPEMANKARELAVAFAKAHRKLTMMKLYDLPKANRTATKRDKVRLAGRSPDDVLALDLPQGRVLIELLDHLAPRHVERIKVLAAKGFYDGLIFFDVKPDFAAITGDPTNTGQGGSGRRLDAEFSKSLFKVGSVGMMRGRNDPNSADSQFFIAYKKMPHLVGKYTKWGQVFSGMEHVKALAQGRPPQVPDAIESLRLLSE
jgi:peptidylprolyl isomerase